MENVQNRNKILKTLAALQNTTTLLQQYKKSILCNIQGNQSAGKKFHHSCMRLPESSWTEITKLRTTQYSALRTVTGRPLMSPNTTTTYVDHSKKIKRTFLNYILTLHMRFKTCVLRTGAMQT